MLFAVFLSIEFRQRSSGHACWLLSNNETAHAFAVERFFKVENGHHFPLELHVVVEARKSAQTVPELKICARHVRLHVISPLRRFFLPISICRQNFCCCCFKTDDDDGLCLRPWCLVAKDANSVNLFCFSLSSDDSVCVVCRLYLTLARPCC